MDSDTARTVRAADASPAGPLTKAESIRVAFAPSRYTRARIYRRRSPMCIFLHGSCEGGYVWDEFVSRDLELSAVVPDLRGHSDSDWDPAGMYSEAKYAEDASRLLNSIGETQLCLVGHSLGAAVAIRIASTDRRVRKLVIVDFGLRMSVEGQSRASDQFRELLRTYATVAEYAELLAAERPLTNRSLIDEFAIRALRQRPDGMFELKCDPALAREENDRATPDDVLSGQLRGVACPTLIIRGAASAVFPPASAQHTVKTMSNARLCSIPMAGHAVMSDNPRGFADVVVPFLSGS